MKLEYGKIKGLDGLVFVLSDGEKIKAVYPFLCKGITLEFACTYLSGKGILLKPRRAKMDWILDIMRGKIKMPMGRLDLRDLTSFQKKIYKELCATLPGEQLYYGDFSVKGARAVGSAMSKNPIPLLIPCHRVRSKNGTENYTIICHVCRPCSCKNKDLNTCSKRIKLRLREIETDE